MLRWNCSPCSRIEGHQEEEEDITEEGEEASAPEVL